MTSDLDGYRESVLDPARQAGNVPPPDLFVRYGLDPRQGCDTEEFARRVEPIVKYWRTLKLQRKYLPLATALLTADTELRRKDQLNFEAFTKQREENRGRARARLDERIDVIAASTPCITVTGLRRLVSAMEGAFDEHEIRATLKTHDIAVVEPWSLPTQPPIGGARSLSGPLTVLGYRLSPEVLFGAEAVRAGFRLRDGFRLVAGGQTVTMTNLENARQEQSRSKQDERKTAIDNVLAILITAADKVHDLLLWEVSEQLRADVEAGLPVRLIAHSATELGLDASEAMELAATLAGDGGGRREVGIAQLVANALQAGELHEARRLLDGLPAEEAAQARAQLDDAVRRVAELVTRAEDAGVAGDQEQAAGLLAEAVEIARDDADLRARLAAIPPPPPSDVAIGIDAGRVAVRWTPSAARTGRIRYRVVRTSETAAVSSSAGTAVVETDANEAMDADLPAAVPTFYTVFAARAGDAWSAGATAGPIEPLPQVVEVSLRTDEKSVSGSWLAHPTAVEVVVTRTRREAPDAAPYRVPVAAGGASTFLDTAVETGSTYDYAFRAAYLTRTGDRRVSEAVLVSVTPTAPPGLVEELTHEFVSDQGTTAMRVLWRPPSGGVVEIRSSVDVPEWPVGTIVSRAAATAFGQPVSGQASVGADGRARLTFPLRHGRVVLTAITLSGEQALIGGTTTLSIVDPVTSVQAERLDNRVKVRWIWPQGANLALLRWWPADGRDPPIHVSESEISLRRYVDSGGAELDAGPGPVTVTVQTLTRSRGEQSESVAVVTTVPGRRTTVIYAVRPTGLPGRRRLHLVLTSDRSCRLPGLVVVHRTDGIVPLHRHSGSTIATFAPRDLSPGRPVVIPLGVRVRPVAGLACFVDPNSPSADEIVLVPAAPR